MKKASLKKQEQLHNEFYEEIERAIEKANSALPLPHILVQGLSLFFEITLDSAPSELEARRMIKEVLNDVAKDMGDNL